MAGLTFRLGQLPDALQTDASNNIGIGAAPSGTYKLEVTGTAKVSSTLLLGGALSGTSATFSGDLTIDTNTLYVDSTNNRVGIGTTSPSYKLHIIESTTNGRAVQGVATATSGTNYGAVLVAEGIGATKNIGLYASAEGATTNVAAIFDKGNVGIGATDPAKKLDVYSTATTNTAQLVVSDASSTNRLYLGTFSNGSYISLGGTYQSGWSANGTNAIANIGMSATSGASTIQFETSATNGAAPTERMRIHSGGNISIGATNDNGYHLQVDGSSGTYGIAILQHGTAGSIPLEINHTVTSGNNKFIQFVTDSTTRGTIYFDRSTTLTVYSTTSDYRLKTELEDFNGLDIIKKLNPKKFRIDKAENKSIGFIAHELQQYFPQAVGGEKDAIEEDGTPIYQSVDYSQLTGLLTKAIQEQQAQIEELKAEIDELKQK